MLDCSICKTHCCGGSPIKAPIILPFELEKFKDETITNGNVYWLKRKKDGTCIHLDSNNKCSIYSTRPTECKLYPWVLSYRNNALTTRQSAGCPQKMKVNQPVLSEDVKNVSEEFWKKFEKEQN